MTRFQPSTMMKSKILKGSDTMTGGNCIIPIDKRTDDTTISMTRNGRNKTKPI